MEVELDDLPSSQLAVPIYSLATTLASMNSIGYMALAVLRGALTRHLKLYTRPGHSYTLQEGDDQCSRCLATEFRDVQRSAESVAQPFACLQWRREGEGEGLVPRGPGQLWGPGTSWIIFYFFDRKSVGDPGF